MEPNRTAVALIIGNEILGGKIHERNVFELARMLRRQGVELRRAVVIPDESRTIAAEVRSLSERFDHVFTSGGVGPTHDDVTIAGVAEAFGVAVVADPDIVKLLRDFYADAFHENHLLLANVPEGAQKLTIDRTPWPVIRFQNVWILPGIPEIFRLKLEVVAAHLDSGVPYVSRAVYTKLDEARLKPLLDRVVARHPKVDVGSYPRWNDPRCETQVTFDGQDAESVERAFEDFRDRLPEGEPQWSE